MRRSTFLHATAGLVGLTIAPSSLAQALPRATVFVVSGRIPRSVTTAEAAVRYARSHRARQIRESTEAEMDDRSWDGTAVLQFNRPIGERNATMLIYDVTDGERSLVGSPYDIYVRNREDTVIVQDFHIARRRRRPNRDLEIVVTVRHQNVGVGRVRIVGEAPRGNGSVDFTAPGVDPGLGP